MQRKTRLTDLLNRLRELHRLKDFDFDDWRKRYMAWMNHKKSRVMDFFRRQDKDNDGKVTRAEFIEGILASSKKKFCFYFFLPVFLSVGCIFNADTFYYSKVLMCVNVVLSFVVRDVQK